MAAAATDDVAAVAVTTPADFLDDDDIDFSIVDGLDLNIDDDDGLDVVRDLDFDLGDMTAADEFRDAYAAFIANADPKVVGGAGGGGWIAGLCGGDGSAETEGSMAGSCVTTDGGALAEDEAVSEFVAELERFLMEDGDCGVEAEAFCPDDFFGDLLATSGSIDGVATGALLHNGGEEEEDNADDDEGGVLAAREDQQASRKRARRKIKGTTLVTPWRGSLEVTTRHLAQIQVPAPWQPAPAAMLLCCV